MLGKPWTSFMCVQCLDMIISLRTEIYHEYGAQPSLMEAFRPLRTFSVAALLVTRLWPEMGLQRRKQRIPTNSVSLWDSATGCAM